MYQYVNEFKHKKSTRYYHNTHSYRLLIWDQHHNKSSIWNFYFSYLISKYSGPSNLRPPMGARKCDFILQVVLK